MRRIRIIGLGAFMVVLGLTAPAASQFTSDGLSPFEQAAQSDLIVVGRVTDIETEPALIETVKGGCKVGHMVGTVRIGENLFGVRGLTHVRVGFVPEVPAPARDPAVKAFT
jgi:hypothetical protein